jgi:hypothetical protein
LQTTRQLLGRWAFSWAARRNRRVRAIRTPRKARVTRGLESPGWRRGRAGLAPLGLRLCFCRTRKRPSAFLGSSPPISATNAGRVCLPDRARRSTFIARSVSYYSKNDEIGIRWAFPDKITFEKIDCYSWQDEYRFAFSITGALDFEKTSQQVQIPPPGWHYRSPETKYNWRASRI